MSLKETQYNNVPKSSRVFISYSHDSPKHKQSVLRLSNRLRSEGVDCNIDQYETCPPEGWFLWMVNQIEEADFVIIVCTENYETRFKGKEEARKGRGAKWEGAVITQELYYSEANNKCIPIVFSHEEAKYIPSILKSATYYALNIEKINDETYDELYARLTDQKLVLKPALGELRHLEPKNMLSSVSSQNKEMDLIRNSQKPVIGELRTITAGDQNSEIPKTFISPSTDMEFLLIPAGEFNMGSEESYSELPIHKVTIKNSFYMGKCQVTQKQWKLIMNDTKYFNYCNLKDLDYPNNWISWYEAKEFIRKLNKMEDTDKYRLPSEAEWEYACRAGTTTRYSFGDDESKLGDYAWYDKNSDGKTHPVGKKKPNLWGLYDIYGNVLELCQDKWHDNYEGAPSDGSAWRDIRVRRESASSHVMRGGSYNNHSGSCRSSNRGKVPPLGRTSNLGFRVVREI